ncbi:metallophosphoesterase [Nitratireductor indicus C115]|uniref:Metallophosphoesterase n=1 Tax=Nitratireductor indicus C115 TaxID=1231190 RepID=K2P6B9_9HYPH|nr:phosphodiesterase [Nitratireductor indicus]EKF42861.1 metallophosphoesterase [Nitratireductor indicus C115]SFQ41416.1 3',5'-cyclic AMP phosphodiesterase CpdA [Nitratireductor indicus]
MSKILQLSDTHIVREGHRAYGVVDTGAALAEVVEAARRSLPLVGPVDLAVVTGDLVDYGIEEEYERFKSLMAPLGIPYRALPGNHDDREMMRSAFAEADWMPESGPINWVAHLEHFSVIGLDSLVSGAPYGLLEDETLAFLKAELDALSGKPVLVAMHHPPFATGIEAMDINNLRNAPALLNLIDTHAGEVRIICGHVHRNVTRTFGKAIALIAPGTSHAVTLDQRENDPPHTLSKEPGAFMMHEWRDNGIVSHQLAGRFVDERSPFDMSLG